MTTALDVVDQADVDRLVEFHGHQCPGLASGIQAARIALREIGPRTTEHDVVAIVETNYCAADAVQGLMHCTFGTLSLLHRDYGKQVFTFVDRTTGRAIRISRRPDVDLPSAPAPSRATDPAATAGSAEEERTRFWDEMNERARRILDMAPDDLFSFEEVDLAPPPKASVHPSVACANCGEKAMETHIRRLDGRELCIPCFERRMLGT